MPKQIEFEESQKFGSWILIPMAISILLPIIGLYVQIVLGKQFGSKPASNTTLWLTLVLTASLTYFIYVLRLKTKITEAGLKMWFSAFVKKDILWRDVRFAQIVQYGFVGGWGIGKRSKQYGKVYNTAGDEGLALELKNGNKILIGSQKTEELSDVLRALRHKGIIK